MNAKPRIGLCRRPIDVYFGDALAGLERLYQAVDAPVLRFGCIGSDGRPATSGTRDAPAVEANGDAEPRLVLLRSTTSALKVCAATGVATKTAAAARITCWRNRLLVIRASILG